MKKFVRFKKPDNLLKGFIRMLGALILYFGINTLLKLPFSSEFLDSGTTAAHLVRLFRYCIVLFLVMGIYPMSFSLFGKKDRA